MSEDVCRSCGEPVVEGRINCPNCGHAYPQIEERPLHPDPDKQGG